MTSAGLPAGPAVPTWTPPSTYLERLEVAERGNLRPTRLLAFGHSWVEGSPGPSRTSLRFASRLAALLGVREDNFGYSGKNTYIQTDNLLPRVMQAVVPPSAAPYQPASQVAVLCSGINDLATADVADNLTILTNSLRSAIRRLRAGGVYEVENAARWTLAQGAGALGWGTNTGTVFNSGSANKQARDNGNTWTLTTPADFPGGTLRIAGFRGVGTGATHAITVDGSAHGTWDTRGGLKTYEPTVYEITGLAAGAHTIVGTISNLVGASEFLDYAEFEAADPGIVVVCNIARSVTYSTGGPHTIVDADVTNANAAIASMLSSTFTDGRVILADLSTLMGNKDASLYYVDGLHPNDKGTALMASYIAGLIRDALPGLSTLAGGQVASFDAPSARRVRETTIDPRAGIATLAAGTKVVSTRAVTANSRIYLTVQALGTVTAPKALAVTARTAGTSFTITSADATDTSQVAWEIVEPEA